MIELLFWYCNIYILYYKANYKCPHSHWVQFLMPAPQPSLNCSALMCGVFPKLVLHIESITYIVSDHPVLASV